MTRTYTAPWEYERTPTPAQLKESDIQYQYCMILNRLERDYGIDRVAEIAKSWGKISYTKKLELVKLLEIELDTKHNALNIPGGDRGTYEETTEVKMIYPSKENPGIIPFGVRVPRKGE